MIENLPYPTIVLPCLIIFAIMLWSYRRSQPVLAVSICCLAVVIVAGLWIDVKTSVVFGTMLLMLGASYMIGGQAEREAVVMSYVLMIFPYLAALFIRGTNREFDPIGALTDLFFMIWLGYIAHRFDRFWSYFASACFMLAVASHLMAFLNPDFQSAAYRGLRSAPGGALVFLLLGASLHAKWRERRARLSEIRLQASPHL
ncbi:MAG: hypothetical protein CL949_09970 [Erythrobacter sp.]|mgnify:CR=1 FL=1|nr:hypothetical protein [Erythrobacter sp.]